MYRRLTFLMVMCGMALVLFPFAAVLRRMDFIAFAVGQALIIVGVFGAIESTVREKK